MLTGNCVNRPGEAVSRFFLTATAMAIPVQMENGTPTRAPFTDPDRSPSNVVFPTILVSGNSSTTTTLVLAGKQGRSESNAQPPVLETGALPIELRPFRTEDRGQRTEDSKTRTRFAADLASLALLSAVRGHATSSAIPCAPCACAPCGSTCSARASCSHP